ncbi:MAG: NAD-dependent epimerase/dehydratase family protein [Gammaproteobacteria bacterium]|uniref:NAD-dependent epimerase/dehydratase family protein n=1 Tax=Candidatus Kutchimonas denitrificans TaxID=3056748 RepID=A0AAE4Z9I4_9BACT|nr:NAD-dependent epimerase/dehydratase family protein [Gemmatimonadota bacterium]NIR75147.1 NAD-dependent epimerase/dehydratase family protein [Candidatus Kutchimonas denitrificans]NIU52957.1 NAD-dependent epimerase/dehydratase family protein [Gemmatimonadota bacterium]NIV52426.1 NAD-dependent epimerase/dehydratase family protein [Gammaproteobacteria bacterium]NIY44846.1 NAD-dependent epimerase/dehydratase family protein [Gemmatimonadota bacterium]
MACFLVTGAAGFIASKVSEQLLDAGHKVIGVDDLNDAYDVRLKEWRLSWLEGRAEFSFVRLDIRDGGALSDLFQSHFGNQKPKCHGVLNLAARAGVRQSVEDPWIYQETNLIGALNLLELCREYEVPKFVLASTSSLYGARNPRPFREDAHTDGPLSPYAASKKAAESICYTYHYLYDLDVTILRYFTVYGPAGRPDMSLFRFTQWIHEERPVTVFGDGTQERDFSYVDDIARGTVAALQPMGFEVINLGSDQPVVLNDAIAVVEKLAGKKAKIERQPRHPADVQATWADISKARQVLGWEPKVSFEEGVEQLVAWYQENREWAREVKTQ